jgi:hypothetical protein
MYIGYEQADPTYVQEKRYFNKWRELKSKKCKYCDTKWDTQDTELKKEL